MDPESSTSFPQRASSGVFPTTHWSVVLRAGGRNSTVSEEALTRLCETYLSPVLSYVRALGSSPADAEDLTQDFMVHFLRRELTARVEQRTGVKFRSFLLRCLKNFLADQRDRATALKRGGEQPSLSLDESDESGLLVREPVDESNAALVYEREWASALLNRVLDRLECEYLARGRRQVFAHLQPLLLDRKGERTYADLASDLRLSPDAVKTEVSRLRARYRELLREEVAHTVTSPLEVEEEIHHLFSVLSR